MDVIKSVLMGILQGITEFLPVSSSGHLSLFRHFFKINGESSGFFSAMLHIGTLVAILIFYRKPIYELVDEFINCIKDIKSKKFNLNYKKMNPVRKMLFMFVISCIPLLVLLIPVGNGNILKDAAEVFYTDDSILAEGICFIVTGFLLLFGSAVSSNTNKFRKLTPFGAFLVGVAQFFAACFPGISRSGSTISTGMCLKVSPKKMVRYSFILSVPTVIASALAELKDAFTTTQIIPVAPLIAGVITSAVVGVFAIRLLHIIIQKNKFKYFGYYCAGLGVIVTIIGLVEKVTGI